MPPKKTIIFRDVIYESITALSKAYDVNPPSVTARLNKGYAIEDALFINEIPSKSNIPISVFGEIFESISAACRHYNIGHSTVRYRLKNGESINEAFTRAKSHIPIKVRINGKEYSNLKEAAKEFEVKHCNVLSRLRYGWSIEEALGIKERPDEDVSGIIYLVRLRRNNKCYIGHSRSTLAKRWKRHCEKAEKGDFRKGSLHEAIVIYGKESFELIILSRSKSLNELINKEKELIAKHDTRAPRGFNLSSGGEKYSNPNEYFIDGIKYATYRELSKAYNLEVSQIASRVSRGMTVKEAVKAPNRYRRYVLNGKKYSGLKDACKHFKLPLSLVKSRLERGWDLEAAFNISSPPKGARLIKPIIIKGEKYKSKTDAARELGLKPSIVKARLRRGWTLNQSYEVEPPPINKHGPKKIMIRNKEYKTIAEVSRQYNLDPVLVRNRINKHGWTIEEALEIIQRKDKILLRGKEYKSYAEAARHYNVGVGNLRRRVNKLGWSIEEALCLVKRVRKRRK